VIVRSPHKLQILVIAQGIGSSNCGAVTYSGFLLLYVKQKSLCNLDSKMFNISVLIWAHSSTLFFVSPPEGMDLLLVFTK
jgi:hypothetical protein